MTEILKLGVDLSREDLVNEDWYWLDQHDYFGLRKIVWSKVRQRFTTLNNIDFNVIKLAYILLDEDTESDIEVDVCIGHPLNIDDILRKRVVIPYKDFEWIEDFTILTITLDEVYNLNANEEIEISIEMVSDNALVELPIDLLGLNGGGVGALFNTVSGETCKLFNPTNQQWVNPINQGNLCFDLYYDESLVPPKFKVVYDANGANIGNVPVDSNDYLSGQVVTVKGNTGYLQKFGYAYLWWNTEPDGSGETYSINQTFIITEDTTLYAKWEKKELPTYPVIHEGKPQPCFNDFLIGYDLRNPNMEFSGAPLMGVAMLANESSFETTFTSDIDVDINYTALLCSFMAHVTELPIKLTIINMDTAQTIYDDETLINTENDMVDIKEDYTVKIMVYKLNQTVKLEKGILYKIIFSVDELDNPSQSIHVYGLNPANIFIESENGEISDTLVMAQWGGNLETYPEPIYLSLSLMELNIYKQIDQFDETDSSIFCPCCGYNRLVWENRCYCMMCGWKNKYHNKWKNYPIAYLIEYYSHPQNGVVDFNNETWYDSTTLPMKLNDPTVKNGFKFIDVWHLHSIGYDYLITDKVLPKGIRDNITLRAMLEYEQYNIIYGSIGGADYINPNAELTSYNIGDLPLTIQPLQMYGYNFLYWSMYINQQPPAINLTNGEVPLGTFGNLMLFPIVDVTPIQYQMIYVLNGGTNGAGNPIFYTVQSIMPIPLTNPTKTGYLFTGWTATHGTLTDNGDGTWNWVRPQFPEPLGNVTLTANWIQVYTVTYVDTEAETGTVPIDNNSYQENQTVIVKGNEGNLALSGKALDGWRKQPAEAITTKLGTNSLQTLTFNGNGAAYPDKRGVLITGTGQRLDSVTFFISNAVSPTTAKVEIYKMNGSMVGNLVGTSNTLNIPLASGNIPYNFDLFANEDLILSQGESYLLVIAILQSVSFNVYLENGSYGVGYRFNSTDNEWTTSNGMTLAYILYKPEIFTIVLDGTQPASFDMPASNVTLKAIWRNPYTYIASGTIDYIPPPPAPPLIPSNSELELLIDGLNDLQSTSKMLLQYFTTKETVTVGNFRINIAGCHHEVSSSMASNTITCVISGIINDIEAQNGIAQFQSMPFTITGYSDQSLSLLLQMVSLGQPTTFVAGKLYALALNVELLNANNDPINMGYVFAQVNDGTENRNLIKPVADLINLTTNQTLVGKKLTFVLA